MHTASLDPDDQYDDDDDGSDGDDDDDDDDDDVDDNDDDVRNNYGLQIKTNTAIAREGVKQLIARM